MALAKKISLLALLLPLTTYVNAEGTAEENAPDPGDHTKVSSVVGATYGVQSLGEADNNWVQLNVQISGAKQNGNLFLGSAALTGQEFNSDIAGQDESFDVTQLRTRYFEVKRTEWENAPMLGVSLDYIENSFVDTATQDRLFAVGGLIRMNTPFKNWLSFPIVAAAVGQNSDFAENFLGADSMSYGVQFNFLNSIYLHENGTHIQLNPQFASIDFGGDMGTINQLQMDTVLQFPLNSNRRHWGKITYTEFFSDAISSNLKHNDKGTELKFQYSYYL
ncbi:hypothetical protein [Vibrio genomosp. F10]|uniref:hypothetical protein n=1 Tax=Vibrio genomosp. F10 TaxID=723171 RepID=UPI0002D60E80|nr:hypothetical protein [Vibrio genomosp. F10]OEF07314.1 hypothetical protein A1QI_17780 [Vibrio genomosp. F10 str. 9ZB36]